MDNGRNYIIERLKSKKVTIDEFNFDKLEAPPLAMFFAPQDIWELNNIAKSIKLSAKLKEKLQMIDTVCKRRGLVKFGAGTNRVVYRHPEFNQIVFKIAYDNVALMDNINEFRNQYILKPFVAKTFEVSPCGTVAIAERVQPIKSREEYISIADDVFTLLNEFIIGKYIMSDIGTQYFANIGLRTTNNFGPVLLDYSFLYELDENKIYCNKPDPSSPSGLCEGEIEYDDGFNHLYCSKCGAKYKAIELKKKIKDNEIIVRGKGDEKMLVNLRGGSVKTNTTVNAGADTFMNTVDSIIKHEEETAKVTSARKVTVNIGGKKEEPTQNVVKVNVQAPVRKNVPPVVEEVAVNGIKVVNKEVKEEPVVEEPAKTSLSEFIDSLPDDEETEELTSPISFDESLIGEREVKTGKSPVELIDEAVDSIIENLNAITIDAVRDDAINRMVDKIGNSIPSNGEAFKNVIKVAISIFNNAEDDDYLDVVHSAEFVEFIKRVFEPSVEVSDVERNGNDLLVRHHIDMNYAYDCEDKAFSTEDTETRIEEVFTESEAEPEKVSPKTTTEEEVDDYKGIEFASGVIINAKSLFPDADSEEIIVGTDEKGDYITNKDGNIIGINIINDCEVKSVDLVSKEWIKAAESFMREEEEEALDIIPESSLGVTQVTEE